MNNTPRQTAQEAREAAAALRHFAANIFYALGLTLVWIGRRIEGKGEGRSGQR